MPTSPSFGSADRIAPSPSSPRGSFLGTVTANRHLCTDHFRLTLNLPHFPPSFPGQFVQLDCRDYARETDTPHETEWSPGTRPTLCDPDFASPVAYLRRPFSIADRRDLPNGTTEIDIIHRVVGRGTSLLARLAPGHQLSLLGPLGVGFAIPDDLQLACLVGGGVGIPPMLYLAKLLAPHPAKRVAVLGAQRRDLLAVSLTQTPSTDATPNTGIAELDPFNCPAIITTDDGSLGTKGFVTTALRQYLSSHLAGISPSKALVFCCGPTPMMKATAKVAAEFAVPCQVSLEQPMACGMGTCQSCIIKYRPHSAPSDTEWKYKLTCTEGPVFDTRDIVW